MRRAAFVALFGGLALACGGGGGSGVSFKDPNSVNFTFGAPVAPVATEQAAADAGLTGIGDAAAVQGQADPNLALAQSQGIANAPNHMSGVFAGSLPVAIEQGQASVVQRASAYLAGNVAAATGGFDNPLCWSVAGTATTGQIVFHHCTVTDPTNSSFTTSIDGSFNRDGGHVYWDATISIHDSEPITGGGTMTLSASERVSGDITFNPAVTPKTIVGFARSEIWLSVAAPSQSLSAAVTYNADYDLEYADSPSFCVTGGTLTLKRIWSEIPSGASGQPDFADAAVQFTFVGDGLTCATGVNVAWGTRQ
jgi:hypothetical protein